MNFLSNLTPFLIRIRPILMSLSILQLLTSVAVVSSGPSKVGTSGPREVSVGEPGGETEEIILPDGTIVDADSPQATAARRAAARGSATAKGGAGGSAAVAGSLGAGVTVDSIKLGFIVVSNNDRLLSNYGVQGGAIGDTKDQVNAVVNDLNARGGILGRKVIADIRVWDATGNAEAQHNQFCAGFTQDSKVFAVLSPWNPPPSFAPCLAKAKTLFINESLLQADQETFTELSPYLVSGLFSSSRGSIAMARALHEQGFFASGSKLGIVRGNTPAFERVSNNYFKPALASFGITPFDEVPASGTSQAQAAAQRFKDKGVDHVAFLTAAGGTPLFFMNFAQSQTYFPKYGLASPDSPAFLAQAAPYSQLRGAMAAGWAPGLDVLDSEGPPYSAAERRCFDVHAKAGTNYPSRNEGGTPALMFCDMVWLFEEAAIKAGKTLNNGTWSEGLATLGTSHQTTITFGTNFGPGIRDGAYQYRPMAYDDSASCRCFKYTGPAQNLPR